MVGRRILSPPDVERILQRMALEILERHYGYALPFIIPASPMGNQLAEKLKTYLQAEGAPPLPDSAPPSEITCLLLVDDVLHTGRTLLRQIVSALTRYPEASIETLVLIDRGHRHYPICADYVGIRLATTLQEYVRVRIGAEGWEVWLE
ncbi:MAG: bifunctional pyr operon transcriptional regulator/uracil phosphoribosyltransferase [Bacteroidia bacterium]|nr:bifunctional pyr operon transcriptional regulator/uracil phosphoribosyltransferase [Bacteroidia bacterium]MCX7651718.1 bifunctional pyr operon transcriptional regulator/uracil phosphoribosyltransferase [Bacteroidia bacterium]MDW8417450.1 bifunctional pyr operon transcriptional regulator/uracil phosphoribosyltransferase [Bacteroidia bacterium]